ncbi:MAG TPA: CpXC domain-containing protein [Anaerolineaceae bacterium]|nr:CpXC domain-containing protein [Anaerolineaceae bacterium]HNZ01165.1 CpXC domain-containing protein [Anaerolineaceae bacterium]HOU44656.1 CpXC domain-containing protein [Anaerolineaceae bacterium]HQF45884.1 CpXC domain-containing protein [Anaerolineaceae bacterium]HQH35809.1 CpXC domain-containing protein [Anaerolineaceae bacterium]
MAQTRVNCPRCRTPIQADVEQLFDLNIDPQAKQRLLSGGVNVVNCPTCGYTGNVSVPIVYHDPDKELLLTFFPPDMGTPVNEQERMIGPLINRVVDRLPAEKRKAYLLRPQAMLTFQTMIDRILEADGITKEMIEEQEQRLNLLRRLLSTSTPEAREEIIRQEESIIDEGFFMMLAQLAEVSMQQGEQRTAQALAGLQAELLEHTNLGRELKERSDETQAAVRSLQEAQEKGLTREKLLDLLVEAPTETRLVALVGLARTGLDYQFFQILSLRIEQATGEEKTRLLTLREKLLDLTRQIDEEIQKQMDEAAKLLETILNAPDIEKATMEHMAEFNDAFVNVIKSELQDAQQRQDGDRFGKLQRIIRILQQASTPPEVELVEQLIGAADEEGRRQILEANSEMVTSEFLQLLNQLAVQSETEGQPAEVVNALQTAYKSAMRFSMERNFRKN